TADGKLQLIDPVACKPIDCLDLHVGAVSTAVVNPTNNHIISAGADCVINVLDSRMTSKGPLLKLKTDLFVAHLQHGLDGSVRWASAGGVYGHFFPASRKMEHM